VQFRHSRTGRAETVARFAQFFEAGGRCDVMLVLGESESRTRELHS
jgi:hypothetical protein